MCLWYQRAGALVFAFSKCGMKLAGSRFNLDIAPNRTDLVGMTICQRPMKTFLQSSPLHDQGKILIPGAP